MEGHTLAERDGYLYVASVYNFSDKPEQITRYYPVSNGYGGKVRVDSYNRELVGAKLEYDTAPGCYLLRRPDPYASLRINLQNGGSTVPDFTETAPVPAPKVRKGLQVRWDCGRWQKYLKTEGWVTA
jgi:hypothetical protein